MKFAIISAGEGSRLQQEGVGLPKPLVELNGVSMIDRLIKIFIDCGATEIVIIINNEQPLTKAHLIEVQKKSRIPIQLVIKSTPSSMHSFYELSKFLCDDKFCLTTVDTVFKEREFKIYIDKFMHSDADGLMAVTDYIDDEKPLYVRTDEALNVTGFFDSVQSDSRYISGGIYCLKPVAIEILQWCIDKGMSRMRNFQRQLVADGLRLKAYPFSKILDVDHVEDLIKAEAFLNEQGKE
ncbi:MAG: nucleotidyltransferase family protein [Phocaeicola sp.]|uniref:nucleotidyltransferase family protein n=1 Tax=Phocaeicola sp. TaxID=2773926 RepID=UPI003FA03E9F